MVGKQTHASLPNKGLNANRVGVQLAVALDQMLHSKYNFEDKFFDEPKSTFEPTKKEKNVDAVNIVPGEDIFYFDCRILPNYNVEDVLADVQKAADELGSKTGAKIEIEIIQKQAAPDVVERNSEVVLLLKKALEMNRGIDVTVWGIGGGTCAAFFRKKGLPAAAWSTIDEVAHQPDEYAKIQNIIDDAKIFALMAII